MQMATLLIQVLIPDLTWEKTEGLNIGVDFALFNNRLSGSIEYYNTKTTDILLNKQLAKKQRNQLHLAQRR